MLTWHSRGVIDFVIFSNFWQTSWDMPYDRLRAELGSEVAIYGCVEDAPNWVSGRAPNLTLEPGTAAPSYSNLGIRYLSASAELLRGNAAGKLAMGMDGIETFNFFCTDQVKIPGLRGDYASLAADRRPCGAPGQAQTLRTVHNHRANLAAMGTSLPGSRDSRTQLEA